MWSSARDLLLTIAFSCSAGTGLILQDADGLSSLARHAVTGGGPDCSLADDAAAIERVEDAFRIQIEKRTPLQISTRHAVIVTPSNPFAGANFTMQAFLALPKLSVAGKLTTAFTKFVVVAHSTLQGPKAISLGIDVCGNSSGLTDTLAASFLRKDVFQRLGSFAPQVVHCGPSEPCPEPTPQALAQQLPLLNALLGPGRSIKGSLLPVVIQGQDVMEASRLGDALGYLVHDGGIWDAERVLFVFAGDLSAGLPAQQEQMCDDRTAQVIAQRGVPQIAEYLHTLLQGGARAGCPGPAAVPTGYGPILSAARVAGQTKMRNRRITTSRSVAHVGFEAPVLGLMSGLFWSDDRSAWERLGSSGQDESLSAASR